MKTKEPTNNYIPILEQTFVAWCTPPSASGCLNQLQAYPEPQLPAPETHKKQQQDRGLPQSKDPQKKRHGRSFSEQFKHVHYNQSVSNWYTDKMYNKRLTVPEMER